MLWMSKEVLANWYAVVDGKRACGGQMRYSDQGPTISTITDKVILIPLIRKRPVGHLFVSGSSLIETQVMGSILRREWRPGREYPLRITWGIDIVQAA